MNIYVYGTDNMCLRDAASIATGISLATGFTIDKETEAEAIRGANEGHGKPIAKGMGWRLYDFFGDFEDFNLVLDDCSMSAAMRSSLKSLLKTANNAYDKHPDGYDDDMGDFIRMIFTKILQK